MNRNSITHRELIEGLIGGDDIPRLPVAFWRHFPVDDQFPDRLANATTFFQKTYDFDLIKVSPSSSFCIRDWGIKDVWNGNSEGTRDYLNNLTLSEAKAINELDPCQGSLGNQLKALEKINMEHKKEIPVIQTIFSPLSQLKNLLGKQNLIHAVRHAPSSLDKILEIITNTTAAFMKECLREQIDGFYFAVQHASSSQMSRDEFLFFGKGYDERLFSQLEKAHINILHVHGENIYFDLMQEYPCQIINWHDRETSPSLLEASRSTGKTLCGGINRISTMVQGTSKEIEEDISDAISQLKHFKFLLGTGCVLPIITPHGNIKHAVSYARGQ
jgi:uroporphyrinogen decarboxylase